MKKILLVGDVTGVFLSSMSMQMKKNGGIIVDGLKIKNPTARLDSGYTNLYSIQIIKIPVIRELYVLLQFSILAIFKMERKKYDVLMIHYVWPEHIFLMPLYRWVAKKVLSVTWGSDILRLEPKNYWHVDHVFKYSDKINCATDDMSLQVRNISKKEIPSDKITSCLFGLKQVERGVFFETVPDVASIGAYVHTTLYDELDTATKIQSMNGIYELSSWEYCVKDWVNL